MSLKRIDQPKRGLTLLELVVVLAILAAIAAAASIATDRILARRRVEVTQQTISAFQRSVLGSFGGAETITSVSQPQAGSALEGFVADLGRVPVATGTDPELQLSELWSNPNGMEPYGRKSAPGDSEVFLNCGWRGPYVDMPIGATRLTDGWGRAMTVLSIDGTGAPKVALAGEPIFGLTSLGSDGLVGVTTTELPLAEDLTIWLGDQVSSPLHADVTVTVYQSDGSGGRGIPAGNGSLMVRLYLPNPATGGVTFLQSPVLNSPFASAPSFAFADVPIGPRVVRAYWQGASSTTLLSPVTPIEVRRGGQATWDLVLPQGGP